MIFFLACVLPSIWIISVDEANRKVRFHQISTYQESSIRDYVMSLDIVNKNSAGGSAGLIVSAKSGHHHSPRLMNASSSRLSTLIATTTTRLPPPLSSTENNVAFMFDDDSNDDGGGTVEKRSAPKLSHRKSNSHEKANSVGGGGLVSTKVIERGSIVGVECCDVKISYWFREDAFQNLFFQTLMLILCISRWLITRAELNLNQRSLILVISVATAADTLDFFGYLGMQMVYSSWHLLYSVLLIVSLSLLQFVFLHVEDDCFSTGASSAHAFSSSGNHSAPTKTSNSMENGDASGDGGGSGSGSGSGGIADVMMMNDDEMTCKADGKKKTSAPFSIFNRQYEFLKRHLKAEESLKKFGNGKKNSFSDFCC